METANPTGSGCLTTLFFIVLTLFVGTHTITMVSDIVDVPPTPLVAVIYQFKSDSNVTAEDQQLTVDIIRQRLTALGITPDVQLNPGSNGNPATIRVLLPANSSLYPTTRLIRFTGDFELVDFSGMETYGFEETGLWTTHEAESMPLRLPELWLRPDTNQPFTTVLDSSHVVLAQTIPDNSLGGWAVEVIFDQEGSALLGTFTADHIGGMLANVVDGYALTMPDIQAPINGEIVIHGNYVESEAQTWVALIGFGALPVPIKLVSMG
jgi:preprotein translocase subunit SecD